MNHYELDKYRRTPYLCTANNKRYIMKTFSQLTWTVLLAGLVASCSSGTEETPSSVPIPISLSCGITPAATRATDTGFETGDRIGLYVVNYEGGTAGSLQATGNHVDNMQFTYDGTWTPATPIYWKDDTTPADFYGYYPYGTTPTDISAVPFTVMADQSTEANYKASDFLWGKTAQVAPTETAVGLTLDHLFSCAVVKVAAGNGFTAESLAAADVQVRLNGATCQASIDLSNGQVTPGTETASISFLQGENNEFKALIVPQTVPSADKFLTVTIDGRDFNMKKEFTFVGGKRHTFTVTVKKTSNGINVDIGSWEDDGADNGGVAE